MYVMYVVHQQADYECIPDLCDALVFGCVEGMVGLGKGEKGWTREILFFSLSSCSSISIHTRTRRQSLVAAGSQLHRHTPRATTTCFYSWCRKKTSRVASQDALVGVRFGGVLKVVARGEGEGERVRGGRWWWLKGHLFPRSACVTLF